MHAHPKPKPPASAQVTRIQLVEPSLLPTNPWSNKPTPIPQILKNVNPQPAGAQGNRIAPRAATPVPSPSSSDSDDDDGEQHRRPCGEEGGNEKEKKKKKKKNKKVMMKKKM